MKGKRLRWKHGEKEKELSGREMGGDERSERKDKERGGGVGDGVRRPDE